LPPGSLNKRPSTLSVIKSAAPATLLVITGKPLAMALTMTKGLIYGRKNEYIASSIVFPKITAVRNKDYSFPYLL
jgi:hypothetical protein